MSTRFMLFLLGILFLLFLLVGPFMKMAKIKTENQKPLDIKFLYSMYLKSGEGAADLYYIEHKSSICYALVGGGRMGNMVAQMNCLKK